jgi:hypothetical protein
MKFPKQCPFVLLLNVGGKEGEVFGSAEGKEMKISGRKKDYRGLKCIRLEWSSKSILEFSPYCKENITLRHYKIGLLMLPKEKVLVYGKNNMKPVNTK